MSLDINYSNTSRIHIEDVKNFVTPTNSLTAAENESDDSITKESIEACVAVAAERICAHCSKVLGKYHGKGPGDSKLCNTHRQAYARAHPRRQQSKIRTTQFLYWSLVLNDTDVDCITHKTEVNQTLKECMQKIRQHWFETIAWRQDKDLFTGNYSTRNPSIPIHRRSSKKISRGAIHTNSN